MTAQPIYADQAKMIVAAVDALEELDKHRHGDNAVGGELTLHYEGLHEPPWAKIVWDADYGSWIGVLL